MNGEISSRFKPGGYREVLRLAWPLIISTGSFTVMMFCDRMFLAWFSAVTIQAALPASILAFSLSCGFMAVAAYSNTFVAQYFGSGDTEGCSRATSQGLLLALISWPFLLLLIPAGRWMLQISGHAPEVLSKELSYFSILMVGSVSSALGAAVSSFFTGRGRTVITMVANVIGNVVNIVLDYVLIFGKCGFPAMGIQGAGWATVVAGFVSPAILLFLFFSRKTDAVFHTRKSFRYHPKLFWRMVKFGLPSGIHLALDVASFTIFVMFTGRMGEAALAVSNIALSINMLAFMPMVGLGIAASILVGQYQGSKQSDVAAQVGWTAFKMGVYYMLIVGLSFILFPKAYLSLFTDRSPDAVALVDIFATGKILLVIMAVWGLLDAANLILGSALKGAGDTRFVMYYSVTMAWGLLVTGQVVIVFVLKAGILVSWAWTAFYIGVMAIGYIWRFKCGRWRSIDVLGVSVPLVPRRPGAEALGITD